MERPISPDERSQIILELGRDPVLAHAVLFGDKHTDETPPFHKEIIADWHSDAPNVLTEAFRGAAKSTLAEEAIVIEACFKRFGNGVVLGESEQRAVDRLRTIKNIFETNEFITELFEIGPGAIWTDAKVTLSNGIMLQAYGRGQSLRGVKYLDVRPDLVFIDDLEDDESVKTPDAREKTRKWFVRTVMPMRAPGARVRFAATPLHPDALAPTLAKDKQFWLTRVYPIIYKNDAGELAATWADRYSVTDALAIKASMEKLGEGDAWVQEYMCEAVNPATQVFTPDLIRIVPQARSWHATYAMYDPARTTNKKSATTGKIVWSWIGRKLVIWAASGRKWMPDEIVKDMFDVDREFNPVVIGVEETGLNEWLMQPIRAEQALRGHSIPLRALHAPKGKLDFIRGLQPYFRAGEVEFACDLPELRDQLLGFPTGDIDIPNALAYALKLRLGQPVYENFSADLIAAELRSAPRSPMWLAVNSDGRNTAAVLVQVTQGQVLVFADWLVEGDPGVALTDILAEASLDVPVHRAPSPDGSKVEGVRLARGALRLVAPKQHWDAYDSIGLRAAARKVPADIQRGGETVDGRAELRSLFTRRTHGAPSLQISANATWTLRAFAGGYCRQLDATEPQDGPYAVLMQGLEAFAAMLRGVGVREVEADRNYATTASGQRYLSARAR